MTSYKGVMCNQCSTNLNIYLIQHDQTDKAIKDNINLTNENYATIAQNLSNITICGQNFCVPTLIKFILSLKSNTQNESIDLELDNLELCRSDNETKQINHHPILNKLIKNK